MNNNVKQATGLEETKKNESFVQSFQLEYVEVNSKCVMYCLSSIEKDKIERELATYSGKEICELLYNVNDVCGKVNTTDGEDVQIRYENGVLELSVANGVFGVTDVLAVLQGDFFPVSEGKLSLHGTGVRAMANLSDQFVLRSGGYNLEFSKSYTDAMYERFKGQLTSSFVQKSITPYEGYSMLALPRIIRDDVYTYGTIISVAVNPGKAPNGGVAVESQLESIDLSLFQRLSHVKRIDIELAGKKILLQKTRVDKYLIMSKLVNGLETEKKSIEA